MIQEIEDLIDGYVKWLRQKTNLRELRDCVQITTPFLDRHNDMIQIYVKRSSDGFVLTDGGETIDDLALDGCRIDTPKRQALLLTTLNGFGVRNENSRLEIDAHAENFSVKKHNLVQSILAVNDLFFLSQPYVASFFLEDVQLWLDSHEVRYIPNAKFTGRSGFDHRFDFTVPKSKSAPERLIRAINNPTKDSAENFVFAWFDTKDVRPANCEAIAFLNDQEKSVSSSVKEALSNYEIITIPWSERERFIDKIAA